MNRRLIKGSKSMAGGCLLQRKKLTISTIALALFVVLGSLLFAQAPGARQQPQSVTTPGSSQAPSSLAASAQGATPEIRVAVVIAPPIVMEQNGSLTGFSIDLWNAMAKQLKVKTIYQIKPDYSAVEKALRSNDTDLTVAATLTSARDEVFDFSLPTLETGLQIMVLDTGVTHAATSPMAPRVQHAPPPVFANDESMDSRRPVDSAHPGSSGLVARTGKRRRHYFEPELLPRHF